MLLSNLLTISHCIRPRPLLPPPPLPGVWGGTSPVFPPPSWLLAVLGPPWPAPGLLASVAGLHPLLPLPSLLPPSGRGYSASQPGLGGLPWRTPTAAGAGSGRPCKVQKMGLTHRLAATVIKFGELKNRIEDSYAVALFKKQKAYV